MSSSDDGLETRGSKYSYSLAKLFNNKDDFKYFHRNLRGVVDDCCKSPCSPNTLGQYCGTTTRSPLMD